MGQRYPQFRKPFRAVPLRRRPLGEDFKAKLFAGCVIVAVVTWQATPLITGEYHSPEAVAQRQAAAEATAKIEASVHYAGCNDARAAGAAPIYAGQPGYRSEMDGDGDGIACEVRY
ncbi:MAG: excalibur calcium-binding domain-containing protein [Sphingomonas sp.]